MICSSCLKDRDDVASFYHYKKSDFSIKAYGSMLENPTNNQKLCQQCRESAEHWTEVQFCDAMGINPVSVAGKIIKKQFEQVGCCGN